MACRTVAIAALAGLLAACSDEAVELHSGERLRLKFVVAPDGAQTAVGIYDSELGVDCWFETAADGVDRCLPASMVEADNNRFADPACSEALLVPNKCEQYAMVQEDGACGTRVFEIGEPFPWGTQPAFKRDESGDCVEIGSTQGEPFYFGLEVPPDRFVAADDRVATGTTRIRARFRYGDDGSVFPTTPYDDSRAETCYPARAIDGELRCLPHASTAWSYYTSDDSCLSPVGEVERAPICASEEGIHYVADVGYTLDASCEDYQRRRLFEIGTEVEEIYESDLGGAPMCMAATPDPSVKYFAAGEEVTASEFAPIEWTPEEGSTRLRRYLLTGDDGFTQSRITSWFWDSQREERCRTALDVDGVLRCLPEAMSVFDQYLDPDCRMVLPVAFRWAHRCDGPPPKYAADSTSWTESCDSTGETLDIFEVGERVQTYGLLAPDWECVPNLDTEPINHEYYRLGPRVPPEAFELLVSTTD